MRPIHAVLWRDGLKAQREFKPRASWGAQVWGPATMDGMQRCSDCACLAVTTIGTSTESVVMGFTGRGNKAEGCFKGKTMLFDLRTPTLCPRRPSNSRRPTTTNHSSPFRFVLLFSFKSKNSNLILKMFPCQKRKRETHLVWQLQNPKSFAGTASYVLLLPCTKVGPTVSPGLLPWPWCFLFPHQPPTVSTCTSAYIGTTESVCKFELSQGNGMREV